MTKIMIILSLLFTVIALITGHTITEIMDVLKLILLLSLRCRF